jgi:hypothetical protein
MNLEDYAEQEGREVYLFEREVEQLEDTKKRR